MEVEHSIVIERGRDEVWEIFEDPDMLVQWQENLISYEQVEGEPGATGSVSKQTIKRSGGETALTVTVVDRRDSEFSESKYEGMQLPFTIANSFKSVGKNKTEWHAVIDVRLNIVQKALAPVLKGSLAELIEQNGAQFKQFVESR
jgi:hypothetical protein